MGLQERLEGSKVDPWYSPDRLEDQLPDWFLVQLPGTDSLRKEISTSALAGALSDLGDVALRRGQLRKAWRCYSRSDELRVGRVNWPVGGYASGKGDVLKAQGRWDEAWIAYAASLKALRQSAVHKGSICKVLISMADIRDAQGQRAEAARLYERAAATYRRTRAGEGY